MQYPKIFPKLKKNTVRTISASTVQAVRDRDKNCILCRNGPIQQIHHVYYGADANYSENRNALDQLVGLCTICHYDLHFKGGNDYRDRCKKYLINFQKGN